MTGRDHLVLLGAEEYIVERDDAGVAPRTTEQAIQTARTGFEYLRV